MGDKTIIGGVSYETLGSSSSNLLLKCNGTARIQWGNKLIDLLKNGKISSSQDFIFNIQDISEIKQDGLYILNSEDDIKLIINKSGIQYYIPDNPLYQGMIIMYYGADIPKGWVICDGKEYDVNGVKIKTPDLTDKFKEIENYYLIMYMNYD